MAATAIHGLQRAARISAGGRQRRNLYQHRQIDGLVEGLFVADTIIEKLRADSEQHCQYQADADCSQRKLEAVGKRRLVRKTGRIDDAELCALLLPFQIGGQRGLLLLGQQFGIFAFSGCRNRASCHSSQLPPPGSHSGGPDTSGQPARDAGFARLEVCSSILLTLIWLCSCTSGVMACTCAELAVFVSSFSLASAPRSFFSFSRPAMVSFSFLMSGWSSV